MAKEEKVSAKPFCVALWATFLMDYVYIKRSYLKRYYASLEKLSFVMVMGPINCSYER